MKSIVISVISGLFGAMIFVVVHTFLYARPIAVVNLEDVIASHLEEQGAKDLSEDERNRVSERFARALDKVIKDVSESERVTLLVAPAVVSNAPNYTSYVKSEVDKHVKGI